MVITAAHITPRVALIAGVLILDAEDLEQLVTRYKKRIEEETGKPFPQDPHAQLWGAIGAVFGSWSLHRPFHPLLALFLFWLRQEETMATVTSPGWALCCRNNSGSTLAAIRRASSRRFLRSLKCER
jgi:hypothetical protein